MPVQIEARRLSGADLGKTVTVPWKRGRTVTGVLKYIEISSSQIEIWVKPDNEEMSEVLPLAHDTKLTITGKPSDFPPTQSHGSLRRAIRT